MKSRYRLFLRRKSVFYAFDKVTKTFESLKTKDRDEAQRLVIAKNEALKQPAMNLSLARVYLRHSDPLVAKRTWQHAMDEIVKTKRGTTQERWQRAIKQSAFEGIRAIPLIETQAEHFLGMLDKGTVSTNVHLRKLHNFCLDMNWLPWPVIPKKQWPPVNFKEKRAITLAEHRLIIDREKNAERRSFYELCWHLGGSQSDVVGYGGLPAALPGSQSFCRRLRMLRKCGMNERVDFPARDLPRLFGFSISERLHLKGCF
jgi:hypothetical protein